MPKVSTINVSFGRKIQTAPYENADASVGVTVAFDHEETQRDIDEEISEAMDTCIAHVCRALGKEVPEWLTPKEENPTNRDGAKKVTPAASPPADMQENGGTRPSISGQTATKPVSPSKPAAKKSKVDFGPAPKKKEDTGEAPPYTSGDVMKAISGAIDRMQKKGQQGASAEVERIVRGYLPEDKPPYSHTQIPATSWGDFISDLNKLGK